MQARPPVGRRGRCTSRFRTPSDAYNIPVEYLEEVINGVEMDISKTRYATFEELREYCYRVASSVGLVCIEIFGYEDPDAREHAVDLGLAMQLTNILRDVEEDMERGRVYIPQEELARFGCSEEDIFQGKGERQLQGVDEVSGGARQGLFQEGQAAFAPAVAPVKGLSRRASRDLQPAAGPHRGVRLQRVWQEGESQHRGEADANGEAMGERDSGKGLGKVVVVGGGLAGMAAACDLADRGHPVTLMEKRPFLGGRAFSFPEPDTGQEIDNGQHVFLGCCTAYIDFLDKLGVSDNTYIPPRLDVPVLGCGGKRGVLRSVGLPAPLHLLPSLLSYPHLTWGEKLRAIYGGLRISLTRRRGGEGGMGGETFAGWLKRHRQTDAAIERFWNLIILPTLNDDISEVSADMGLMVFQEGVLKSRASAAIGYARVGLSELVSEAVKSYLWRPGAGRRCWGRGPGGSAWTAAW